MKRIRITALPNEDRSQELRRLAIVRRDLYSHSPVEIDPDNPAYRTHLDADDRAYFELSTDLVDEVRRVLRECGHDKYLSIDEVAGPAGEPCLKCGHVSGPMTPPVCPNCGFREISPCPECGRDVARQEYKHKPVDGDIFRCPRCDAYVRLRFNDPLTRADGTYNEPVVVVEAVAQQPV
jgi:hypothetical protein